MANCLARRTLRAALLGTAGFGLFLRSLTNVPLVQLFGTGPKRAMADDRMRTKTFLETGIPPHDAAEAPGRQREMAPLAGSQAP
jgi:hypothetical protein